MLICVSCNFIYPLIRCLFLFFFFSSRRRHTRFDCDWSSDVCSSDLMIVPPIPSGARPPNIPPPLWPRRSSTLLLCPPGLHRICVRLKSYQSKGKRRDRKSVV